MAIQLAVEPEIVRRTANFQPSIWGDRFINCDAELDNLTRASMQQQVEDLKVAVRREFPSSRNGLSCRDQLNLIDAVQRLGLTYHFETEIEQALHQIHATFHEQVHGGDADLFKVSLAFRLLRQHRYNVSSGVFKKFKDANGVSFKECLVADVPGMLSLYEAAHLAVGGEEILDEALAFTTSHLESTAPDHPLAQQITQALEQPLQKTLERLYAKNYISIYQHEASHNEFLLKLAKLEFNLVQLSHKEELSEIARWWKGLDFERKLPFARDRIVECFFWITGVYFEPQNLLGRKIVTKIGVVATVMDDIYDSFATFEELKVFTEAIERWDANCMDELELPQYMRPFYLALLNCLNEVEEEMAKQGKSYRIYYAKEILKIEARLYFDEAKWSHEGRIPSMEEYVRVRVTSIGSYMVSVLALVGMGDIVTKETFEWMLSNPKIVRASSLIFRFMNDIEGSKFEKERGDCASSIDCYMKQYGVSEQETVDVFNKQIADCWKDINEEMLIKPLSTDQVVPMPVLMIVLNLTRAVDLIYKKGDSFTHVGKVMKQSIASLFIDPLPL